MPVTSASDRDALLAAAAQLAPTFDADRLASELATVTSHRWLPQRTSMASGVGEAATIDWRVLPLRSPGGDPERTDPGGPDPVGFAPTPWLDRLPYLSEILERLPAPLNAARLMALGPGATSRLHRDPKYALGRGLVRLHIPLATNPGAVLVLDGVEHRWLPGTLWWGDFSRRHSVRNTGPATRVHAVVDALLTRELAGWFPIGWQAATARGDLLLNRPTPEPAPCPVPLPLAVQLPEGLVDFGCDEPLAGALAPGLLTEDAGRIVLAAGGHRFELALVDGRGEYRFAGWSEERTVQPRRDGVVLRSRRGGTPTERFVPAPETGGHLP